MLRSATSLLVVLLVVPALLGQTTGAPGVNDFTINGNGSGGTSCVASNAIGTVTLAVSGLPGSQLLGGAANACQANAMPNVTTSGNSLDLNLASLSFWIDGTQTVVPGFPGQFAATNSNGNWSLTVTAPTAFSVGLQFAVINSGYAGGFDVTQAHDLSVVVPQCATLPTPGPTADDTGILITLSTPFPFYGTTQTAVGINPNGNLSFGAANSDFTESEAEFLSMQPRIAPTWDDFSPNISGSVTYQEAGGFFSVAWIQVPTFGNTDQNSFCCTLDQSTGTITYFWDQMDLAPGNTAQLVGISPGGGLSGMNNVDISTATPGTPILAAGAMDAIYEDFNLGLGASGTVFDLAGGSKMFIPTGGVGTGPYQAQ